MQIKLRQFIKYTHILGGIGLSFFTLNAHTVSPKKQTKTRPAAVIKVKKKSRKLHQVVLTQVNFKALPKWHDANLMPSFQAFKSSCRYLLKQNPAHHVGSRYLDMTAADWQSACQTALTMRTPNAQKAKSFFEHEFYPISFTQKHRQGLFTGYYVPSVAGRLKQDAFYNTPIYGLPYAIPTLKHYAYLTRAQIDKGMLVKKAPVLAWIHSPVDRFFLEIEGSGMIQLPHHAPLYISYAGENGAPFTSIASILIKQGLLTRANASQANIKRYFDTHPARAKPLLAQNKSFVFFQALKHAHALGAQGIDLIPGYSMAVDKRWIPLGAPVWLATKIPQKNHETSFKRLMIAQDTGGAIKGAMRGDIFWGTGKRASFLGEHMKCSGVYWLLLPKATVKRLLA